MNPHVPVQGVDGQLQHDGLVRGRRVCLPACAAAACAALAAGSYPRCRPVAHAAFVLVAALGSKILLKKSPLGKTTNFVKTFAVSTRHAAAWSCSANLYQVISLISVLVCVLRPANLYIARGTLKECNIQRTQDTNVPQSI